ncbi:hypothetical protein PST407_05685 [Pseudomonas syringae pv. tomato]|nr:hypothetical protein PST407_05685 [Pseudomonas syringae pv. tomato]
MARNGKCAWIVRWDMTVPSRRHLYTRENTKA